MKLFYSDAVSWTKLGNFVFVINESTNTLYKFEGALKEFWIILESYSDFSDVAQHLLTKYNVTRNVIEKDLKNVIQVLENQNLLDRR